MLPSEATVRGDRRKPVRDRPRVRRGRPKWHSRRASEAQDGGKDNEAHEGPVRPAASDGPGHPHHPGARRRGARRVERELHGHVRPTSGNVFTAGNLDVTGQRHRRHPHGQQHEAWRQPSPAPSPSRTPAPSAAPFTLSSVMRTTARQLTTPLFDRLKLHAHQITRGRTTASTPSYNVHGLDAALTTPLTLNTGNGVFGGSTCPTPTASRVTLPRHGVHGTPASGNDNAFMNKSRHHRPRVGRPISD